MRIAIMAAGAVGGYFGARLAAARHEVVFFARGANLQAIRAHGLKVESPRGNLHLKDVTVTDSADGIAPVDVVLFAVKLWDSEQAAQTIKPLVGEMTRVITVQNGVDGVAMIEPVVGRGRVVPGLAQISAVIAAPGVISHSSQYQTLTFGHADGRDDAVVQAFAEAGTAAGVDFLISKQIERDLWTKFILLVALSSVTAATRQPIGVARNDPDGKKLLQTIVDEVAAVGRARGVKLEEAVVQRAAAVVFGVPDSTKASMAHDLDRGNRLELDWLAGRVVSLGRELNVPVPVCETIYTVLKPYRMGSPNPRRAG
jgi:2-dehydropantoate 2-reductase